MVLTSTVTLRRQWIDKLDRQRLTTELRTSGVNLKYPETREKSHIVLESSNPIDLCEAVRKIKQLVNHQLVSSNSGSSVQSNETDKMTTRDDVEVEKEVDKEHKKKDASFKGEKTLSVEDWEHDHTGRDMAKDNDGKTATDGKEEQQKDDTGQSPETEGPEADPARDEATQHKRLTSTGGSGPDDDDSQGDMASVKSEHATVAESAQTRIGDAEGVQAETEDTEPSEDHRIASVKERSKQVQHNADETNVSTNYDVAATSYERQSEKYQIDEPLWAYIQFIYPHFKWDKKLLPPHDTKQGSKTVELTGSSADIDDLKKVCEKSRLQRAITRKFQQVPDRYIAESFQHDLRDLSHGKVLVRLVADEPRYCELVGKKSDIAELEKEISKHYAEVVEKKQIPDIQQSTTSTGPTSATQAASVTNSFAAANTASSPAAAAAARRNDYSRGFDQMPAGMREQMSEIGFHFQTALAQMRVQIVTGDLLEWRCEVLVDPCDSDLSHAGGLSKLIAKAAGHQMQVECAAYKRQHGYLPQCGVMDTSAGKIQPPVRRVIHACGSNVRSCHSQNDCGMMLEQTFLNCLICANDKLLARSIALPAISSGKASLTSSYHVRATLNIALLISIDTLHYILVQFVYFSVCSFNRL